MRSDDVREAAHSCVAALGVATDRDWAAAPAHGIELTVAGVVAHIAEMLFRYAVDLAHGPRRGDALSVSVRPDAAPAMLLTTVESGVVVLTAVLDTLPDNALGFHPQGPVNPSRFAAMACDEILVHTDDAARGLGLCFEPDAHLAAHVLRRLFPAAPHGERSWPTLRSENGRGPAHAADAGTPCRRAHPR